MSASYPAAIEEHLQLDSPPPCILCHTTAQGGPGSAQTPFAKSMKTLGLKGRGDQTSLLEALEAAEAEALDSDEDGTPDIEELRAAGTLEGDATGAAGATTIEHDPLPRATTCAFEPNAQAPSALAFVLSLAAAIRTLRKPGPQGPTRHR